jgi:hypothetical protein
VSREEVKGGMRGIRRFAVADVYVVVYVLIQPE